MKLRADDFWLLARSGAFDGYAKSELIEGEIWVMSAIHSWHAKTVSRLNVALHAALLAAGSNLEIFVPVSILLSEDSVPEPDLAVAEDHDDGPLPLAKVKLAVEVSDTTLEIDLGRKALLYARHGVPEYWVIGREGACLYRHHGPEAEGYENRDEFGLGERVEAATIAGLVVETAALV
ncbi:MAG TPA: Uma2 family endonuclease [Allosphingosinicella sp.]|nr:Uma2 family endonuclease [Allosphingosinicella sp.]